MVVTSLPGREITTNREDKVAEYLVKHGICHRRNPVWCFQCKDYFMHTNSSFPTKCFISNHPLNGTGQWCQPDFLIVEPKYPERVHEDENGKVKYEIYSDQCREKPDNNKKLPRPRVLAAIMVNEDDHYKNERERNKVASQVDEFEIAGLHVYVLRELELDHASDLFMTALMVYLGIAVNNSTYHEMYSRGKEYFENTCSYRELCGRT